MSDSATTTKPATIKEFLPCKFSQDELFAFSKDLARKIQELSASQDEKQAAMAQFTNRIKGAEAEINALSTKINNGYEHRNVECEVRLHVPNQYEKTIVRIDTGETLRVVPMTKQELQESLPFQAPEEAKANAEEFLEKAEIV